MTSVAETTVPRLNSKKLKSEKPEIYDEYTEMTKKKGYLKITLKGEKE